MATNYSNTAAFEKSQTITVNGVTMSVKEFKQKYATKKKRTPKQETEITLLPNEIKSLMKGAKVMRSLSAYYKHGYRQWGNICKTILNLKEIQSPFVRYTMSARECDKVIKETDKIAKHNSKFVYAYVRKLAWRLEDASKDMKDLYEGINASGVLNSPLADHECINGEGRRLGLNVLMARTFWAIRDIDNIVRKLQKVADEA